ncbi:MAG TPA: molybdate ABC transporter substrate-binding protein [Propioniciclava tarda]|nr:molybdate ABC transporter substrate-binding protein [Propioniciclava tarda]
MKKLVAALAAALVLAGCSAPAGTSSPAVASGKTVTVFAAASLKGAFTKIGDAFGAETGAKVSYNFNGSSALVDQLKGGAPADVFASADESNMKKATDAALTSGKPTLFATNVLTLAVAPGNPAKITGLDASLDGKKLVVCAVGVPCGNALATLEKNLGVSPKPVSQEQTVTDVLGKVTSGEADAGVVYATDAKSAGAKVTAVAIPGSEKVVNNYPIAATASTKDAALARAYIDYVTGPKGQAILTEFGFGKP